ncbi:MAG: DivIVA domain-containing protein [Clostridia bacterium]|nr:DivIVA domain-containing protein [Clostridia bacterium]
MPITVPMIEEKEFKTKVRGYDPVEVDEFLDEICDEMIVMQEEIARLQAQLAQTKRDLAYVQPAPQRPAPAPVQDVSESAQKLMANAQRLYDETIAQAREEAAAIVAKAKDSVSDELVGEKAALEQQVSEMHANAKAYRDKIIGLMDEMRSMLDAAELD